VAEISGARTSSNIPAVMLRSMSRRTQPYRKGQARMPGPALTAMLRGRTAGGFNPADITRGAFLAKASTRGRGRPKRPVRPKRPARPAR
jgi:phage tail tape-measure protein